MAIKEYKEAILLNPKFLYARDHLTALLEKRGKHKEALEVTQEAVKISPDSPNRRRQEGSLCMELEKFEDAEKAFKHTIEVEKGKNSALNNLNIGKSMLAQPEKINLAFNFLNDADKAVQRRSENTGSVVKREIFLNYGDFYLKTGNVKSADQNLRFAMDKVPNDPDDRERDDVKMAKAGEVYLKNNYLDKAKSLMEKVLDEDPKNKERQQLVHNIYKKHKKEQLADDLIKFAMNKADEAILMANAENLKRRKNAVHLVEQGKFEEAKKVFLEAINQYDELLKKYPSDDGLLFNKGVLLSQVLEKILNSLDNETIQMFQEEKIDLFKRAYKLDPERISEGLKKIGISLSDIGL
jgi:tetratricopeptide (TPR) repeat protein